MPFSLPEKVRTERAVAALLVLVVVVGVVDDMPRAFGIDPQVRILDHPICRDGC